MLLYFIVNIELDFMIKEVLRVSTLILSEETDIINKDKYIDLYEIKGFPTSHFFGFLGDNK